MKKSRFTEFLIRHNGLDKSRFEEWIFCPGMLFNDPYKWWGCGGIRQRPHEGLDFCFYRDKAGQEHSLDEGIKIPVMYEGEIIHIEDDFLGKSIFVSHGIYDGLGNRFHTIYGHTNPCSGIDIGKVLSEGEVIAAIADVGKKKTEISPHLHISVAWLPKSFPYERLNWKTISNRSMATLRDPLEFIDCKYQIKESQICIKTIGNGQTTKVTES